MRGAGLLRVLLVGVLGAGAVAGSTSLDRRWGPVAVPHEEVRALPAATTPVASRTLVCPGPETVGVPGLPEGTSQPVDVVVGAAPPAVPGRVGTGLPEAPALVRTLPGRAEVGRAARPGDHARARVDGARGVLATATGRQSPALAGMQQSLVTTGEGAALASSPCGEPSADSWLLAGAGRPGRQEHLVLTNPHDTAVTLDVALHGARGPLPAPTGRGIVVPAGGRTVVLLDALDAQEASPAAHVTVRGGSVHAALRDGWLDGIVPRGADTTVPAGAPATEHLVAGVQVASDQDPVVVRVASTAPRAADVTVTVLGPRGPVPLPPQRGRVRAGAVLDLGLPALPAGAYAVRVDASADVVVAASVGRADGSRRPGPAAVTSPVHDFAWVPAAPAVTDLVGLPLAVPAGGAVSRSLVLAQPGDRPAEVTVTVVGPAGEARPRLVVVPPRGVSSVDLPGATGVWLRPRAGERAGTVRATVVSEAPGGRTTATPVPARMQSTVPYVVVPAR